MLSIKLKSIQKESNPKDGLRVCVMRRIKPHYAFDLWLPQLAPSETLLKEYVVRKTINWERFSVLYKKNVLRQNKELIKSLVVLSKYTKLTFLCWELQSSRCHRSLLLNECKKYFKR